MAADEEHLRLLSIFHYVLGALGCLFACLPLIHAALGLTMIYAPETFGAHGAPQFPEFAGWLFGEMGTVPYYGATRSGISGSEWDERR